MRLRPPPDARATWIVAYDIVDDRRRRRVARLLEAHAHRLQKSVFEANLTSEELRTLAAHLTRLIHPAEDRLDFFPLCATCTARRRHAGPHPPVHPTPILVL